MGPGGGGGVVEGCGGVDLHRIGCMRGHGEKPYHQGGSESVGSV